MFYNIEQICGWTKLNVCDGFMQDPLLPGILLRGVELACLSGYFFFLGLPNDIKLQTKALIVGSPIKN